MIGTFLEEPRPPSERMAFLYQTIALYPNRYRVHDIRVARGMRYAVGYLLLETNIGRLEQLHLLKLAF